MAEIADKPKSRAKAKPAAAPATLTLGEIADKLWQLREDKRALDKQVKVIETEIVALTESAIETLDAQDTRKAEGRKASISVNSVVVPNTVDWDETMKFIVTGKRGDKMAYAHLVQHRISAPAYSELRALGMTIPGQQDFTKRNLSITTLSA